MCRQARRCFVRRDETFGDGRAGQGSSFVAISAGNDKNWGEQRESCAGRTGQGRAGQGRAKQSRVSKAKRN